MKAIHAPRHKTTIDVDFFREMGFLKLRNVLSSTQVRQLGQAMANGIASLEQSPNGYNVTAAADSFWNGGGEANDNGWSLQHDLDSLASAVRESDCPRLVDALPEKQRRGKFLLDTSVWRRTPILADFAQKSILPEIASELLGAPSIRFYDDQMFVKEGGAVDRAAFHQDLSYFHLEGEAGCVFWIPMDVVREGSGRIGYIPGSHNWLQMYKPNIFVSEMPFPGSVGIEMPNINADPQAYGVQYIDANPGDILVHHFLTIHGSEGNRTGNRRRAFSLRYCDAKMTYKHKPGAPFQPLHKLNQQDGEDLDNKIHPMVWPR
jgi:hypothetical protein